MVVTSAFCWDEEQITEFTVDLTTGEGTCGCGSTDTWDGESLYALMRD